MDLSPWYHVCTKVIYISSRTNGYGETRNVFPYSVQKPLLPVRAVKLPHLKGLGKRPRTETCVNWGGPIAMVPCLLQGNICIQRKKSMERPEMYSHSRCKNASNSVARQTTPSEGRRYRAENGNLRQLGWTYRHGTVFAPRQCLYQKQTMCMERPDMYSSRRCTNTCYLCGPSNYSVSRESA